jgi:hypothetical protein
LLAQVLTEDLIERLGAQNHTLRAMSKIYLQRLSQILTQNEHLYAVLLAIMMKKVFRVLSLIRIA